MQYSQEHLKTMVYAKFGGQTECIMGNWKIGNSFQFLLFKDNSPRCRKHKYFKVPLNLHVDIGHNTRISNSFIYETCLLWVGSGSLSNTMLRIIDFTGLTLKLLTQ